MKKYINRLFLAACCATLLVGCDSDTNIPEMTKVVLPKITADPNQDQLINVLKDPALFDATVIVDMYFKDIPQEATLVVAKNLHYDNVKTIQAISQYPTSVKITGSMLQSLFGENIAADDVFEIGLNTKCNNIDYKAFNSTGISYSSDLYNLPGSSPIQVFEATYLLSLDDFVGNFHVVDEWWEEEYDVTITKASETQLSVEGMLGGLDEKPMTIDVNMATQIPNISTQTVLWGDLTPVFGAPYTNMKYGGPGKFDMLNQVINFKVTASVDQGTFSGTYGLVFTKIK